jgi:hypothetical protein
VRVNARTIGPVTSRIPIDRLGVDRDADIARDVGCAPTTIRRARVGLGIPVPRSVPPHVVPLLGTRPDIDIAREYGIPKSTIAYERMRLGVDAFVGERSPLQTDARVLRLLDTARTVSELAHSLGVRVAVARAHVERLAEEGRIVSLGDGLWVVA